jgi:proliferating cell nuclear antigen
VFGMGTGVSLPLWPSPAHLIQTYIYSFPLRKIYKKIVFEGREDDKMFHAKTKLNILREMVDIIYTVVPEAKFDVDEEGIHIKAVDPSRIAMISLDLEKSAFSEYDSDEGSFGVDLEKMKDVLKLGSLDTDVTLDQDNEENLFILKVGNITRKMPLIDDSNMTDPKVPNLDLPSKVVAPVVEIKKGLSAAKSIGDNIILKIDENGFDLSSKSEGADQASLHLGKDDLIELDAGKSARSTYPLEYFSKIISPIKSPNVEIKIGTDYPLNLSFKIASGNGDVKYLLAPRVENY